MKKRIRKFEIDFRLWRYPEVNKNNWIGFSNKIYLVEGETDDDLEFKIHEYIKNHYFYKNAISINQRNSNDVSKNIDLVEYTITEQKL